MLVDLTGGFDYDAMFGTLGDAPIRRVLAFTTHALAQADAAVARALRPRRDEGDADGGAAARCSREG